MLKGVDAVRAGATRLEGIASRFYREASDRSTDAASRKLLGDLASAELDHLRAAGTIKDKRQPGERRAKTTMRTAASCSISFSSGSSG